MIASISIVEQFPIWVGYSGRIIAFAIAILMVLLNTPTHGKIENHSKLVSCSIYRITKRPKVRRILG